MLFQNDYQLDSPISSSDHIQGSEDALFTIVEYGDYQCPYCGQAYSVVKQLQEHYGDKMRFVFRNFPLSNIHKYAQKAAEATEIAAEYGKFWPMHDIVFENQKHLADSDLSDYAATVGIDRVAFTKKLDSDETAAQVKADFMSGVNSGVNGTPSFYINNVKYAGAWDYRSFREVLDQLIIK